MMVNASPTAVRTKKITRREKGDYGKVEFARYNFTT